MKKIINYIKDNIWKFFEKNICEYGNCYGTINCYYRCEKKTIKEKIHYYLLCFYRWLERIEKQYFIVKNITKYVWKSYFDYSMGQIVSSYEDIKNYEKKGYIRLSSEEMKKIAKENKKYNEQKATEKRKTKLKEGIRQIKQGRSFFNEEIEAYNNFTRQQKEEIKKLNYIISKKNQAKS